MVQSQSPLLKRFNVFFVLPALDLSLLLLFLRPAVSGALAQLGKYELGFVYTFNQFTGKKSETKSKREKSLKTYTLLSALLYARHLGD